MTKQQAQELDHQERLAYDRQREAWNNWTDRYSQKQADAWYGAVQEHQQAAEKLLRAQLDQPHLFAAFSAAF